MIKEPSEKAYIDLLSPRTSLPPEIINQCVWLSFRFSLSFRDIEEIMAERGGIVTSETIPQGSVRTETTEKHSGRMGHFLLLVAMRLFVSLSVKR